jgi:hypothetical protein
MKLSLMTLSLAVFVSACGSGTSDLLRGDDVEEEEGKPASVESSATAPGAEKPSGPVATNSPAGKEFYKKNVHPTLAQKCGSCHGSAGPGPAWLTAADSEKSYAQLFQVGYVVKESRIVQKAAHGGSTTNVLATAEAKTYEEWVAMELKDGGKEAPPKVLEKLGSCFDRQKFDAMQMGQWRTTPRRNENPNNCTGCRLDPCSTCHSADPATNYKNAVGSPLLPADSTFEESKLTNPAYITKYFGVSPDGKPIASDAIKKKSEATQKDKPYSHPMFTLKSEHQAALDAFVSDVITKFNAGSCGK